MRPAPRVVSSPRLSKRAAPQRVLLGAAAVAVVLMGLQHAGAFLAPVLFGAMVAGASAPLVSWLNRRGVPMMLSAALVLAMDLCGLGALGWLLLSSTADLEQRLPGYAERLVGMTNGMTHHLGTNATLRDVLHPERLSGALSSIAERFAGVVSFGAVSLFVVFFALCEGDGIQKRLRALQPSFAPALDRVERVMADVRSYLLVKSFSSLLAASATWLIVDAFDLPLAPLLALTMFLLHFVPNVGAPIGTMIVIGIAYAERGPGTALAVGSALGAIAIMVGSVLEPHLLGRTLRLSPLVVLIGMLFWGWLWGPVGALLSVPLMVVVKTVLENSEHAWLAQLLGNRPAVEPPRPEPALVVLRRAPTPPPIPLTVPTPPGQNAS